VASGALRAHHCADGSIMEGLTSNIFAIMDDTVFTAKDGVLYGTVRHLLLKVCEAHGIKVVEAAPKLSDISKWQGCIVSSTSRLALPVAEVQLCNADGTVREAHSIATDGLVARIDQLVDSEVSRNSERLPE
jgi:branched-subunit amino acid aminotransferase/4-amino-4-deoxychorismate lyase